MRDRRRSSESCLHRGIGRRVSSSGAGGVDIESRHPELRMGERVTQVELIVRAIKSLRSAHDPFVPLKQIYLRVERDARLEGMAEVWEMDSLHSTIRGVINNSVVGGARGDGLFVRHRARTGSYALSGRGERAR